MGSIHLSVDEFFTRLSSLFDSRRKADHGSVFLTQKRLSPHSPPQTSSPSDPDIPFADLKPSDPLPILIRATNGKSKEHRKDKIKLSTIVQANELDAFFARYADVMKAGMSGLKKRDRRGRKKAKAKKKKGGGDGAAALVEKK
ncbi:MAG: hypothetical protein Q9190_002785 [Brigantiaea leucoxantha]